MILKRQVVTAAWRRRELKNENDGPFIRESVAHDLWGPPEADRHLDVHYRRTGG